MAFLYITILTVHVVLSRNWSHTLIKVTGKIKLMHEIDHFGDPL